MDLGLLSLLITVLVFGVVGWIVAGQRHGRSGVKTFAILSLVAALGFLFGGQIIVFGVDQFWILLRWLVVSACVGSGLRLALTNRRLRQAESV